MQPVDTARMMAIIMMKALKADLGLSHMKSAEISESIVIGCSETIGALESSHKPPP